MSIAALDSMSTFVKPEVHIFQTNFLKSMWRCDVFEMPTRLYRPRRVHFMTQLEKKHVNERGELYRSPYRIPTNV